jgi:hypothetical protein
LALKSGVTINKPTFDSLLEEDHKALVAYRAEVDELFDLHHKVTRQGLVLEDATPIIIHKAEVNTGGTIQPIAFFR